jgi:hypothetical protein
LKSPDVIVKKYRAEDLFAIFEANQQTDFEGEISDPVETAKMFEDGMAVSIFHEGKIMASMGIIPMWPGVGKAWLNISHVAVGHPKVLLKETRKWLRTAMLSMELLRVEADADVSVKGASTFLKHVGFKYQCIRRKYWRGRDYAHFDFVR